MERANRHRHLAKRAFLVSAAIAVAASGYFLYRGEVVTSVVLGGVILATGYTEYRRRLRDAAVIEDETSDPFERRERNR